MATLYNNIENDLVTNRARIILILPEGLIGDKASIVTQAALSGGDVAGVIIPPYSLDNSAYKYHLQNLIPKIQSNNVSAIVVDDINLALQLRANGLHLTQIHQHISNVIKELREKMFIGIGNLDTRHKSLEAGENQPDYVFFGKFGEDKHNHCHKKTIDLCHWWSELIEIPCIIPAGSSIENILEAANTGADFVGLSKAIFGKPDSAREMVTRANLILENNAPNF